MAAPKTMNIPKSAIRPFGVIGFPKFDLIEHSHKAFRDALDYLNSVMNDGWCGRASIRAIIDSFMREAGADYVSIRIRGPFMTNRDDRMKEVPPGEEEYVHHITVRYTVPGGPLEHVGGPVWAKGIPR